MKLKIIHTLLLLFAVYLHLRADDAAPMHRPLSGNSSMFIIHIDIWNRPASKKITDLIPEDLKPWRVFNISPSVFHNETTGEFNIVPYGLETVYSWGRICGKQSIYIRNGKKIVVE